MSQIQHFKLWQLPLSGKCLHLPDNGAFIVLRVMAFMFVEYAALLSGHYPGICALLQSIVCSFELLSVANCMKKVTLQELLRRHHSIAHALEQQLQSLHQAHCLMLPSMSYFNDPPNIQTSSYNGPASYLSRGIKHIAAR